MKGIVSKRLISLGIENCKEITPVWPWPHSCMAMDLMSLESCLKKVDSLDLDQHYNVVKKDHLSRYTKDVSFLSLRYFDGNITVLLGNNLLKLKLFLCKFSKHAFKDIHIACPKMRCFQLALCSNLGPKSVKSLSKMQHVKLFLSPENSTNVSMLRRYNIDYERLKISTRKQPVGDFELRLGS